MDGQWCMHVRIPRTNNAGLPWATWVDGSSRWLTHSGTMQSGSSLRAAQENMKKDTTTRITLEEATRRKGEGKTDLERRGREDKAGLEPIRDPDGGEFDWSRARVAMPRPKQPISVRLDADVLEFLESSSYCPPVHSSCSNRLG